MLSGALLGSLMLAQSSFAQKMVVAHHLVGFTFSYGVQDWLGDMSLAQQAGIDGFALNVGVDDFQEARVADAYNAAQQLGNFKLFVSLDMTSLPCQALSNADRLRAYVTTYANHPNQYKVNGKPFLSTFSGESCTFGQANPLQGWQNALKNPLGGNVYFVPSFFADTNAQFSGLAPVMDGDFNWNSGWPLDLTSPPSDPNALLADLQTDQAFINAVGNPGAQKTYMAAVTPWFFTHYSPQTFNKNFIYTGDQWLFATRWEQVIANRDKIDIVQIVSWNDFSESHYVGPIHVDQPNSQQWVNGFEHTGWLKLVKHYAEQFRTGNAPAITQDTIVMWSRPHPDNAVASNDPVGRPTRFEATKDILWAVVLATSPAQVTLSTSSSNSQTSNVPAGVSKLQIPIQAGGIMHGVIQRNGQTVVDLQPGGFSFNGSPATYNFNAFVAAAPA